MGFGEVMLKGLVRGVQVQWHCEVYRNYSGSGLGQLETTIQCNVVSHWLRPYREWSMFVGRHHCRWRASRRLKSPAVYSTACSRQQPTQITKLMWPTWGPPGAQVGPTLASRTLPSGKVRITCPLSGKSTGDPSERATDAELVFMLWRHHAFGTHWNISGRAWESDHVVGAGWPWADGCRWGPGNSFRSSRSRLKLPKDHLGMYVDRPSRLCWGRTRESRRCRKISRLTEKCNKYGHFPSDTCRKWVTSLLERRPWPLLLTWFNFNPSMDK